MTAPSTRGTPATRGAGGPRVRTTGGLVEGRWVGSTAVFLGIPYAEAPVGTRRWLAPQRRRPWSGVRAAVEPGATPQRRPMMPFSTIPEESVPGDDTLHVSVWTPEPDRDASLPVMVWIHGGGFVGGIPSSPWYDGSSFAENGVVVVSVSYRLGFEGFGLVDGGDDNRALLDWIAALEWVRAEIAGFGGDPDRVTIAGQSAGGGAVAALLASPAAAGLFHQAILESPAIGALDRDTAQRRSEEMAAELGRPTTLADLADIDIDDVLDAQLRLVPFAAEGADKTLDRALEDDGRVDLYFAPVVDGLLLPRDSAVPSGEVPILIGTTAHEFNMTVFGVAAELDASTPEELLGRRGVPGDVTAAVMEEMRVSSSAALVGQLVTDRTFRRPVDAFVRARDGESWLYDFRWRSPGLGMAMHCLELPFVWNLLDAPRADEVLGDDPPRWLASAMHDAWVSFIRSGDPGWPPVTSRSPVGMVFDTESRVVTDPYAASRRSAVLSPRVGGSI